MVRYGICCSIAIIFILLGFVPLHASTFDGQASAVFRNPTPATATFHGAGTSNFTWGVGRAGDLESGFTFAGKTIVADINTPFSLGTLSYFNGVTLLGTEISSVDLSVTIALTMPASITKEFTEKLSIVTSPNNGDPNASGDSVIFPASFPKFTFAVDGANYILDIIGFGNIDNSGFITLVQGFHTQEQYGAEVELLCRITNASLIVGLGDSVAAGYGLGSDGNDVSYPMQVLLKWGLKHGYSGKNLAISGAISGDCNEHCRLECRYMVPPDSCISTCLEGSADQHQAPCHSVIEHEMDKLNGNSPRIVTLTVGANDIDFSQCLQEWLSGNITDNPTSNGCWPTSVDLHDKLALLRRNLEVIFQTLDGSEIFVTTYYNPFPRDTDALCKPFYMPLAAYSIYVKDLRLASLSYIKQIAVQFQSSTFSFASAVLVELNRTITEAAAPYPHVHIVSLDFSKHSFCRRISQAWAYGTALDAWFTYLHRGFPTRWEYQNALPSSCVAPPESESEPSIDKGGSLFGLRYFVNCMPHPVGRGQMAIRKAVIAAIKAQKIK